MKIFNQLDTEINSFLYQSVQISEGYKFNQYLLVKRIMLYQNNHYPTGKLTSQGDYKYWIDITQPRVDSEVKNIDYDTKAIQAWSESYKDAGAMILINLSLKEWMRTTGQSSELNDAVEEFSSLGNVVWKKVKGGYERCDLKNFYVINPQAFSLKNTPVIERHILDSSQMRSKIGVWNENVQKAIDLCGNKFYQTTPDTGFDLKQTKYYEVHERNGEIDEATLFEAMGKEGGDENKYVLAKIVTCGLTPGGGSAEGAFVLYAKPISEMPYKEAHRGRYKGRWWREGLVEVLMDCQTRANEISNQIARGLEWAGKTIFRTSDDLLAQNIITDMENGDVIRANELEQVEMRMHGLDQLIADWNRNLETADKLANSYEVVTGESMPSGTPFKLGAMVNQNANKLFDFLREKLSTAFEDLVEDWVLPDMLRDLKAKKVLRLTGDPNILNRFYDIVIDSWYCQNLLTMPPHGEELTEVIKGQKREEIMQNPEQLIQLEQGWADEIKPRISVVISGEHVSMTEDLTTLATFIQLEADPVRRTALIERAMKRKGIDVEDLPKTPPAPPAGAEGAPGMGAGKQAIQGQLSPNREFSFNEMGNG